MSKEIARTMARSVVFALVVLVVLVVSGASAQGGGYVVRGKARVIDGNSIVVDGTKVRLSGVDAPETKDRYGAKAKAALKKKVGTKSIGCMIDGTWSGNNWGYCGDPDKESSRDIRKTLNAWMVRSGNALADRDWNLFLKEERQAKSKGKGLWK